MALEPEPQPEVRTSGQLIRQADDAILAPIQDLSPAGVDRLRRFLGVPNPVTFDKGKKQVTNEDVRINVLLHGAVQHEEGFLPQPPEGIVNRGPEAVAIYHRVWKEDGRHITEDQLDDAPELAYYTGDGFSPETRALMTEMGPGYAEVTDTKGLADLAQGNDATEPGPTLNLEE